MSWIKLLYANYDSSVFKSNLFYFSIKTKSINDSNFNKIHNIPFLIKHNLYKVQIKIIKSFILIYVYINYSELTRIINNNEKIPVRNDLFILLKYNIKKFKFNEKIFTNMMNNCGKKDTLLNKIKYNKNNIIHYKQIEINLDKETIQIIRNKSQSFLKLNTYIKMYDKLNLNVKKTQKNLIIIDKISPILKKLNLPIISKDNYNSFYLNSLLNQNTICIDLNLIKSSKYYKKYESFHSSGNILESFKNFRKYIYSNTSKKIKFYNVELLRFNNIYFIDVLEENYNNKHLYHFNQIIQCDKIIFYENIFKFNINYSKFNKIRNLIIKNNEINLDKNINAFILKQILDNNIFKYNATTKNLNIPKLDKYLSFRIFFNTYIFEDLLKKYNIDYEFKLTKNKYNHNYNCPISYETFNNKIFVELSCGHKFLFSNFLKHLFYRQTCPLCLKKVCNSKITIKSSKSILKNEFLLNISLDKNTKYFMIIQDKKLRYYLQKRYSSIDNNITCVSIKSLFEETQFTKNEKIEIFYNNSITKLNKLKINHIIKNIQDSNKVNVNILI